MKATRNKPKSKAPIMIAGVAVAISLIVITGYFQFGSEDPIEVYYNLRFENGSRIWIPESQSTAYELRNGTILNSTPEELLTIIEFQSYQIKTINLKDGTTNYFLHTVEGMGSTSKENIRD